MNVSNLTLKHAVAALFLQLNFKGTFPAMGKLNRCFFFVLYRLLIKTDNCQRRTSLNAQKYNFGVNVKGRKYTLLVLKRSLVFFCKESGGKFRGCIAIFTFFVSAVRAR